jgi:prepilin-type N-terminal cleavage/methylation domain-containing protein
MRGRGGFTLVEVIVAVALLSVVALGLATTLIGAQQGRAATEKWMQATQLAAAGMEQLRAGHVLGPLEAPGDFDRSASVTPWSDHPGLYRLEVTVSWNDGIGHRVQLTTLARR